MNWKVGDRGMGKWSGMLYQIIRLTPDEKRAYVKNLKTGGEAPYPIPFRNWIPTVKKIRHHPLTKIFQDGNF